MYQPEKLKARRKELKLTQKEIAEQLGISFQAYSAWERGVKEPSKEKVAQLEDLLKVPKGYFTQIEIVRLYNSLSNQGKEKVVVYARNLAQEEQAKKVTAISEKLKARRKELKLTQKEIAEKLRISFQAYSAWERGVKEPSKEKVKQLEEILKVPKGYFTQIEIVRLYNSLSNKGKEKVVVYARNLAQEEQAKKVTAISEKLYEYHVYECMSAGIGASVYDDWNFDTVYFNEELAHDFASWVSGDSMEPKYQNGSVALIRETGFDYDGAVYAVVCNNQTYIKRVYREEDGLRLVSINPKYKDIHISYEEDPRIVGIIVGNFEPMEG